MLVGLSGAGKSAAGGAAARLLDAPFADLDDIIARRTGGSIARLFAEGGEVEFRALERDAMDAALAGPPAVIAAGGGWPAVPGNLERLAGRALVIYLRTDPAVAAGRLEAGGAAERPLLAGRAPAAALRDLLGRRAVYYEAADRVVDTDGRTTDEVAAEVAALARSSAGW